MKFYLTFHKKHHVPGYVSKSGYKLPFGYLLFISTTFPYKMMIDKLEKIPHTIDLNNTLGEAEDYKKVKKLLLDLVMYKQRRAMRPLVVNNKIK